MISWQGSRSSQRERPAGALSRGVSRRTVTGVEPRDAVELARLGDAVAIAIRRGARGDLARIGNAVDITECQPRYVIAEYLEHHDGERCLQGIGSRRIEPPVSGFPEWTDRTTETPQRPAQSLPSDGGVNDG